MIKSIFACGMAALLVSACQKQAPLKPAETANPARVPESADILLGGPPTFVLVTLWNSGPAKGLCSGHPINCVTLSTEDGVTVKPHLKALLDEVVESGSPEATAEVFHDAEMAQLFGPDVARTLQSGNFYLAKSFDHAGIATYMAGTTYPVTLDNFTFGIQGRYMESSEIVEIPHP